MSDRYLYHYVTAADWEASLAAGVHEVSGRGMTLQQQGFIHLCYGGQRAGVWRRHWAGVDEPVLLLTVDPDDLPDDLVDENTSGGTEMFPHLYAPLPIGAVIAVHEVDAGGAPVGG